MADWTASMQQSYEYYIVDPGTWMDKYRIDNVTGCTITRDSEAETLGSATIDITESVGEAYIRVYLVVIQNGVREKFPLGTFLVQTPSSAFDGRIRTVSMDAYTSIMELKENQPPLGYFTPEDTNIMEEATRLTNEHARAPVVGGLSETTMYKDFVSNTDDTWLTYISDMIANAKFYFDIDEMGRILFAPKQDTASLQPVWNYTDDNASIVYSDITLEHDIFQIPNAVEVVYSDANDTYYAYVENTEDGSPVSIQNRGRVICERVNNPDLGGVPTQLMVDEYAEQYLRDISTFEYTIKYKHGYNGVRMGDCVLLNFTKFGVADTKARVISQQIECGDGCPVTETAVYSVKLWR